MPIILQQGMPNAQIVLIDHIYESRKDSLSKDGNDS